MKATREGPSRWKVVVVGRHAEVLRSGGRFPFNLVGLSATPVDRLSTFPTLFLSSRMQNEHAGEKLFEERAIRVGTVTVLNKST
jgi:hypothetical protein